MYEYEILLLSNETTADRLSMIAILNEYGKAGWFVYKVETDFYVKTWVFFLRRDV